MTSFPMHLCIECNTEIAHLGLEFGGIKRAAMAQSTRQAPGGRSLDLARQEPTEVFAALFIK